MFSGWILSILGVVILGVLVDIIVPEGRINKYIKSVFTIFTVFVVFMPIANALNGGIDLSGLIYNETAGEIDYEFLDKTKTSMENQLALMCEKALEDGGFLECDVTIYLNLLESEFSVDKVEINLEDLVISTNIPHINKYTEIKAIIKNTISVTEENIILYEGR